MSRTRRDHKAQSAFGHAYIGVPDHKCGRDNNVELIGEPQRVAWEIEVEDNG
jgi:hypothetical protein